MKHFCILFLLTFYPYCISLGASDLAPNTAYTATISAPAHVRVEVRAPAWIEVSAPVYVGGDTWRAELRTQDANAIGRVELWVDGALVAAQDVREGTPPVYRVWMPVVGR